MTHEAESSDQSPPHSALLVAAVLSPGRAGAQKKDVASYQVSVRVADKPMTGVPLRLVSPTDSSVTVITDADGEATLQAPKGKYRLVTSSPASYRGSMLEWDVPVELKGGMFAKMQNRKRLTEDEAHFADPLQLTVQGALVTVLGARGAGTGIVLTHNGVIATSSSLLDEYNAPLVQIDSVTKVPARPLLVDSSGIALIKVSDRSCAHCTPLPRSDAPRQWTKRDLLRIVHVHPIAGPEDAAVLVESGDAASARTEVTWLGNLLGATVVDPDGAVAGIVVRDSPTLTISDTVRGSVESSRSYVIRPVSRAWAILATADTVDRATGPDTLFPVLSRATTSKRCAQRDGGRSIGDFRGPQGRRRKLGGGR